MDKVIEKKIDCEPTWVQLVPILVSSTNEKCAIEELTKIAKIADKVRAAQKKGEMIVFDFTKEGLKNESRR